MSRHHVITIVALLLISGALFATYQFYFKEKLEAYTKAEQEMNSLNTRLGDLNRKFKGMEPREYVKLLKGQVQPHAEAAEQRATYFTLRDLWVKEEVPEDQATMAKFYYEKKYNEKLTALLQDAYAHVPQVQLRPDVFTAFFGVPAPQDVENYAVNKEDVEEWLTRINFGSELVRMMLKANVGSLDAMVMWPPRDEYPFLQMYTMGLSFQMRAEDLVPFLDGLRRADRYFSVNALRIDNPNLLATYGSPYLRVNMLLTVAKYVEEKSIGRTNGGTVTATSAPVGGARPGGMTPLGAGLVSPLGGGTAAVDTSSSSESWWQRLWPF